ncbi:chemotaxis protein CheW [Telmatospirillum sp.]|uniref:chemotaxis protein CheW n=1 Tax=Telmatospirillum sp. TaxID=2079197 RepID=UPI002847C365|nr:chemotaxis protein CheW [Telmatospirillum sp.]MDR3437990.1 chemotaxis protein CheW [Telmatospirillum sp.]
MTATAIARDGTQYVTLGIDQGVFAVEVEEVREILDMRPTSHVPNAPSFMMGLIDVRGHSVPVIDLRIKLGLPAIPPTEHTRIIVLEVTTDERLRLVGLVADRVFEVTSLTEGQSEPPPDLGMRWHSDYIQSIGRRGEAFVIVFNIDHLLSSAEAAEIAVAR